MLNIKKTTGKPTRLLEVLNEFSKLAFPFILTILLIRIFEYKAIASKFFIANAGHYELAGLPYDLWACGVYCAMMLALFGILQFAGIRIAKSFFHFTNILTILLYLSLLIVFSERNRPFDHEFFTRSFSESWTTSKQMLTSGVSLYIPIILFISLYIVTTRWIFSRISFRPWLLYSFMVVTLIAAEFYRYSMPDAKQFKLPGAYYLQCNKFSFWIKDCFEYLTQDDQSDARHLSDKELENEISFYQQQQPFEFTNKEYPLLHRNNGKDVLGPFFNLPASPPNIVILVVEGLSRDFSGDNAYASSFTPFLDSLSKKSLVWDNFLSTAPGTFAAHPAIEGSLPYGTKGFSVLPKMPDHQSLISILKQNGYFTKFLIGFNPDFDNMGGFIEKQGIDFMLQLKDYDDRFKMMGVGSEGWSMGYPDDNLYQRSFEVMDSLPKQPYLDIYHTGTTHEPYLFEQSPVYEKLFDEKMKTVPVTASVKKTLKACKQVLITYMFSDDCIRKFFADYSKRPEFGNTIFFITGDHHIGSFPSTGNIDDYHVPLIVYSPLLKAPEKFYSVNSHNNLAPTITSMLFNNYKLPNIPEEVHWMGDVMDTCRSFRNIHSMPFMLWSRAITDYIYKGYMISEGELFTITPDLMQEPCTNDSVKKHITRLLENFRRINSYVCTFNKVYPSK